MNFDSERAVLLTSAREKIGEAAEELEEILPDTAEELSWIWENLRQEIRTAQKAYAEGRLREGGAV